MISKTESALQELEETSYWLELLDQAEIVRPDGVADLIEEANQLAAIFVAGVKTLKARRNK
jgi:four helix bundle protein